ncbi:MAG: toxin-antitoxin system YwqK family antitoxin [Aureispira sp.]|nr:toxin-antitoxin system YwqK family antitoxin [Aureispira sp.]
MKAIKIISTGLFLCYLVACTPADTTEHATNNTITTDNEGVTISVELVDKVKYNEDSTFKMTYQVDKATDAKYGVYKEYDVLTSTLLSERNYKNNKLEGVEKIYFSNGQVDGEFKYKNGMHEGVFKYYYEDGTLKQQGTYVKGVIEGILTSYYPTGALREEVMHDDGLTQGPFKEYNENGTIKAEGEYTSKSGQEDLEHGLFKDYDENGKLIRKMICKEGQCCTIWTLDDGDIEPKTKLCDAILSEQAS